MPIVWPLSPPLLLTGPSSAEFIKDVHVLLHISFCFENPRIGWTCVSILPLFPDIYRRIFSSGSGTCTTAFRIPALDIVWSTNLNLALINNNLNHCLDLVAYIFSFFFNEKAHCNFVGLSMYYTRCWHTIPIEWSYLTERNTTNNLTHS